MYNVCMTYDNTQDLDRQHQLVVCRERVSELETRVTHLEQALEQLSRDYAELVLVAAKPRNGVSQ